MQTILNLLRKLQNRWGLTSLRQVLLILIVFSLTGSTVVLLRPLVFSWVGISEDTSGIIRGICYVGFIIPAYQLCLLGYGWIFGQYHYFIRRYQKLIPSRYNPNHKSYLSINKHTP